MTCNNYEFDLSNSWDDCMVGSYKAIFELNIDNLVEYFNKEDVEGAHQYFLDRLKYILPSDMEVVEKAINIGIDPRYRNDQFLITSCSINLSLVRFFVDKCGCDINADNSMTLYNAIAYHNYDIAEYLLQNGVFVTEQIIVIANNDVRYIDLLVKYGISMEKIFEIFLLKTMDGIYFCDTLKYFAKYQIGMDNLINQMVDSS